MRIPLSLLAAVLMALGLPVSAHALPSTCFATLPGPEGAEWQIKANGSLSTRLAVGLDRAFAADHGVLVIGGSVYPSIPNDPLAFDRTGNTITFPSRTFGPFSVSRSVSVATDGRLRFLDTVRNTSADLQLVGYDLANEITSSQVGFESESGDARADDHDDWFLLRDDALFPYLQWGLHGSGAETQGREGATLLNPDQTEDWAPGFSDGDESSRFHYLADLVPGETVRFLHVSGAALSSAAATAQAKDGAAAFMGYSQAVARTVINWGPDPDLDGVPASSDACPGIKGDLANGCWSLIAQPVDPTDPTPPPTDPPAPEPTPGPTPSPPAGDRTAPTIKVTRLGAKVRRGRLARRGLRPAFACDEACSLQVRVSVRRKKKVVQVAARTRRALSAKAFRPRIKVSRRTLRRLARQRLTIVVVAADAAGNESRVARRVKLRR
jgi:hypothetical protein